MKNREEQVFDWKKERAEIIESFLKELVKIRKPAASTIGEALAHVYLSIPDEEQDLE
jgi:hypothetical protein